MRTRIGIWTGLALVTALVTTGSAVGQTYTWDGGSLTDPNWIVPNNWVGNVSPNPGQNTVIQFAGTTLLNTNQVSANPFELNQLTFTNTAGAFNLTGNPLLFRRNTSTSHPDLILNSSNAITIANEIRIETGANLNASGSGAGTVSLNGPIVGGSNTSIQKFGDYTLVLGSASNTTWSGYVSVGSGTVRTSATGALNGVDVNVTPDGTVSLNGFSQTIGSMTFFNDGVANTIGARVSTGSGTLTLGGTVTYTPAASGGSPFALISGNLNLGTTGTRTFNIGLQTGSNGFEFYTDADITAPAGGGVSKTGAGDWFARSGGWTFSGTTAITNGRIIAGATNVLSPNSTVSLSGDGQLSLQYVSGSTQTFVNSDQRIGGLSGTSTTTFVNLGNATLTVGANDATTSYAGKITGAGRLVKVGTGTLTLTGSNTFSGGVEIQQGVLAVPTVASLGSSAGVTKVLAGGQLRFTDNTTAGRTFDLTGGGAVSVDDATTVFYNSSTINGGFLRGLGTHSLVGGTTATATTVLAGTNVLIPVGSSATLTNVTMGGNLSVTGAGTKMWDGGRLTESGTLAVGAGAVLNVAQWSSTGVTTITGGAGSSGGRINNTGNGVVFGGGSRTYVGSVATRGGTINLGGQNLELNGGLLVNNGDFVSNGVGGIQNGTVRVNYGSLAKGTGYYEEVNVTDGGRFAPGNSITNTTSGTLTLNSGSTYEFEINRAAGTAGGGGTTPPVGWDLLNLNVAFNANATPASPAVIQLVSRNTNDTAGGTLPDFTPTQSYQWLAFRVNSGGNINGFSPDEFTFDTSAFVNLTNPDGVGTFALSRVGNDLFVTFTPVPEPASVLAVAVGVLGGGAWLRRRWRRVRPAGGAM